MRTLCQEGPSLPPPPPAPASAASASWPLPVALPRCHLPPHSLGTPSSPQLAGLVALPGLTHPRGPALGSTWEPGVLGQPCLDDSPCGLSLWPGPDLPPGPRDPAVPQGTGRRGPGPGLHPRMHGPLPALPALPHCKPRVQEASIHQHIHRHSTHQEAPFSVRKQVVLRAGSGLPLLGTLTFDTSGPSLAWAF